MGNFATYAGLAVLVIFSIFGASPEVSFWAGLITFFLLLVPEALCAISEQGSRQLHRHASKAGSANTSSQKPIMPTTKPVEEPKPTMEQLIGQCVRCSSFGGSAVIVTVKKERLVVRLDTGVNIGVLPAIYNPATCTDIRWPPFALKTIQKIIEAGFSNDPKLQLIIVSAYCVGKESTGHPIDVCYISIQADVETFKRILPGTLDPSEFLANFCARFGMVGESKQRLTVTHIKPFEESTTSPEPNAPASILDLEPVQFEKLAGSLLEGMGYRITYTAITGDGGVDLTAVNHTPIIGGTLVVQCKRYKPGNNVGEPVLRDLYGTVHDRRASKGILITTSDFTPAARRFAEGKPLDLINGADLQSILKQDAATNPKTRATGQDSGKQSQKRAA